MNIKLELLSDSICRIVKNNLGSIDIDIDQIAQTASISALSEIQRIIQNDNLDDFNKIDEIVEIFTKYNIDSGNCHDFG